MSKMTSYITDNARNPSEMSDEKIQTQPEKTFPMQTQLEQSFDGWKDRVDNAFLGFDNVDIAILSLVYMRRTNLTFSGLRAWAFPFIVRELRQSNILIGIEAIRKRIKSILSFDMLREKTDPYRKSKYNNVKFYYPLDGEKQVVYIQNKIEQKKKEWFK